MPTSYDPEQWRELFVTIGATAGTLVGLLFVVMSLHLGRIGRRSDVNVQATTQGARYNTYHLLTCFVETVVLLTPQPLPLIGLELVILNLFGLRLPITMIVTYLRRNLTISERGGFPTRLIATIIVAYLVGAAGGLALMMDGVWGLYLVTFSCVAKIVRSALTAWMLMFAVVPEQSDGPVPSPVAAGAPAKSPVRRTRARLKR